MNSNKTNFNKSKLSVFYKFFIGFVIFYLFFRYAPNPFKIKANTIKVQEAEYIDSLESEAILIKSEDVVYASKKGVFEKKVDEGKRVASGKEIGILKSTENNENLYLQLDNLNKSINEMRSLELNLEDINYGELAPNDILFKFKDSIQKNIKNRNYESVYLLKDRARTVVDPNYEVDTLESLKDLESKRDKISHEINESFTKYYAENGAIISYKIDGLETKYRPIDFEKYSFNIISEDLNKKNSESKKDDDIYTEGEGLFKTIDNFNWYLAIKIDNIKEINKIKDNSYVLVQFPDYNFEDYGKNIIINKSKENAIMILKFKDRLHDIYDSRFLKVNLVKNRLYGLELPKKAIVTLNNKKGVYIKEASGIIRFREIDIIGEGNENIFISSGLDGYIERNNKKVKTVKLFDELVINPSGVKDGMITY